MSIQSEIDRISGNVQDTISAIRQTGVAVPSGANSDNLPSLAAALANEKQDKLTGTEGQIVGFDSSGNAVAQDASQSTKYRTVTLAAASWSDSSQTVTVSGILANETSQLIQPMPAIASQKAYMEAGIYCSGQGANSLTFTCSSVPTEDITVYVTIQGVSS